MVNLIPPAYSGFSDVRIQIYTSAFRRVQDLVIPQVPSGAVVTIKLTDKWGTNLANGIYYLFITTSQGRSKGKLVIAQ